MEVNGMPDVRKPVTFGSNDGRLEQILWHSENDPEEAILDELTDLSTREARTDAEQARLAELFDQLEQFDHSENTLSKEEIEARLRELHERVQVPFAEDSATTAVAQKTKLINEKSIDDTKTSSISLISQSIFGTPWIPQMGMLTMAIFQHIWIITFVVFMIFLLNKPKSLIACGDIFIH